MTVWMGIVAWMRRLSMAKFLSMVIEDRGNVIWPTLFFDDRLDDAVDVMMDAFVHDRPFLHSLLMCFFFLFQVSNMKREKALTHVS